MFTESEFTVLNRLICSGILAGLLGIMLYTGQMEFASATFGLIVGLVAPVGHIVETTREVLKNGRE